MTTITENNANAGISLIQPSILKQTIGERSNITEEQLDHLVQHICKHPISSTYVRPEGDRVRTISCKADGSKWIYFNRHNRGQTDQIAGRGNFKKAVYVINVKTGELAIRTTEYCSPQIDSKKEELDIIDLLHEHQVPGVIKLYHHEVFRSKTEIP
jgi:hypothetical protein